MLIFTSANRLRKRRLASNSGNFILFHLLWVAAIFGAAEGSSVWALLVLALMVVQAGYSLGSWRLDAAMMLAGALVGVSFEMLLLATGLIEYRLQWLPGLPPLWIMALWMGFAMSFNHALGWLARHLGLAALLGAIASVVSVFTGIHFGAAASLKPMPLAIVYALGWAVMVPEFARAAWYLAGSTDLQRSVSADHD